jgi:nascent polypeptide-associated complex subunit alpha
VELVATQTGVSQDEAREALKDANGDLAEAILRLS